MGFHPRCFSTRQPRGTPQPQTNIRTQCWILAGPGGYRSPSISLHEMFVSLLAPRTWERAPPRGDKHQPEGWTEQGWLQIPGTGKPRERGGSWGWRALSSPVCMEAGGTRGCFRRSLLLAHHLEAGMGLLQVESPSGVLTTCNHGAAGSSSRSWQRYKHQSVCIQHGWD